MKRALAIVALVAISCAAGWWLGRTHEPTASAVAPVQRDGVETPPVAVGDVARTARRAQAPAATLPPPEQPLRDSFDTLDALARAGNAQAACRLAAELFTCAQAQHVEHRRVPLERRLEMLAKRLENGKNSPETVAQIEREMKKAEEDDARQSAQFDHCRDSDPGSRPSPSRYLLLPALRGHRLSRMWYLGQMSTGELLRDPGLGPEYLANAPVLLQRGIEEGDMLVVLMWMVAVQNPEITPLSAALPKEWRSRGLANELLARIRELPGAGVAFPVDTTIRATPEEKAEAGRLFEAHFRNARLPALMEQVAMFGDRDVQSFACDELAER